MDYSQYKQLEFRRKFWKFLGAEILVIDPNSQSTIGFIKMKAWKLREDIRLFTDTSLAQEVIAIHARQIIDFGATYDVTDSTNGIRVFSLRRKGLRSAFVRDKWEILDAQEQVIGQILETSGTLALLRRWLSIISDLFDLVFMFVAQTYTMSLNGPDGQPVTVAMITHRKSPFVVKMGLDSSMAPLPVDPHLNVAAGALLSIIDASKNS